MKARGFVAGAALVLISGAAQADDHSEARRHFDLGRKARASGDLATAIAEFEQSIASERSVGALLNLGGVYEEQARHRMALDAYEQARTFALSLGDARAAEALDAERAIRTSRSWVTVVVAPAAAALAGLTVVVDDEPVPKSELNTEIFRAHAQHRIVVTADGREPLTLTTSDHGAIEIGPDALPVRASPTKPVPLAVAASTERPTNWKAWAALGGGGIATGLGVVATVAYASTRSDIRREQASLATACATRRCPADAAAQSTANQSHYAANNHRAAAELGASFGAGALLFAGAAYFFGTGASVDVTPHGASVGLRTIF